MEGIMYKWTNYWNGWQPRWFVLEKGVLAYYKSQDEVKQGCKGSVQLSVCEIIVHPTDILRIDIVIPYEQHFYLKAPSSQERHAWMVALGNAKAGLPPSLPKIIMDKVTSENDLVRSKKSELRITCDLLMKQVYNIKTACNNPDGINIQKLDEASALLSATCDTFIQTLEECMILTDTSRGPHIASDLAPPITIMSKDKKLKSSTVGPMPQNVTDRKLQSS